MALVTFTNLRTAFLNLHWRRGLRTGLAVGGAMLVCLLLNHNMGWAALGALQVVMVDNGGPYRSRFANSLTVLIGGSLALALGTLAGASLTHALIITILFCFIATLARVLSQPLASSSVVILVCYIVAYGNPEHTLAFGLSAASDFVLGGIGAGALTLILWPVDPFRPARNAVADVYTTLAQLAHLLPATQSPETTPKFNETLAHFRIQIETAQQSLTDTPARMTARTIRARNLSVLTESADLLLARIIRIAELSASSTSKAPYRLAPIVTWFSASLAPIEPALRQRPPQGVSAFAPFGSFSVELRRSLAYVESTIAKDPNFDPNGHIVAALHDALLNFEVSYEAIRAIWSGAEPRRNETSAFRDPLPTRTVSNLSSFAVPGSPTSVLGSLGWLGGGPASLPTPLSLWLDTLRANLSLNSVMFRHALRLCIVVGIDVFLLDYIHISHGYWLPMTSIIVLQPYTGETLRRSGQRVAGTIAGGLLAAVAAASIHSEAGILAVVTIGAAVSVALYTVDYVWYCFFLTPTIVLMTLPQLRDWHFAAVRMGMTGVGALVAVLAMIFLWPEHASLQLPALLARGAAADAAYLRAMLAYWQALSAGCPGSGPSDPGTKSLTGRHLVAERSILAPARRQCGLAVNDAEETLDHSLLEHSILVARAHPETEKLNRAALTFTTYLRRLTQTITTLAPIGDITGNLSTLIPHYAERLDAVAYCIQHNQRVPSHPTLDAIPNAGDALTRLDRQVNVLEDTANNLIFKTS